MLHRTPRLATIVLLIAAAHTAGVARAGKSPCPEGKVIADLGITLECNCTIDLAGDPSRWSWRFRSEPTVRGLNAGGPAVGRLESGDVIVALEGKLITTAEAGLRFARLRPGVPVVMSVRRGGEQQSVVITPEATCLDEVGFPAPQAAEARAARAAGAIEPEAWTPEPSLFERSETPEAPEPPEPPEPIQPLQPRQAPRAATPATLPRPRGWIGVGMDCGDCAIRHDADRTPVWNFDSHPQVSYVDPGSPAATAGIRRGDVLTHVDGVSLLTEEGGRRFGGMRPGKAIRLKLRRGTESPTLVVVPAVRPGSEAALPKLQEELRSLTDRKRIDEMRKGLSQIQQRIDRLERQKTTATGKQRLRYSGTVGNSDVVVRGLGTVVVSEDEKTGEVVITTNDATIRISPGDKKPKR
jgi:hypothetical protein